MLVLDFIFHFYRYGLGPSLSLLASSSCLPVSPSPLFTSVFVFGQCTIYLQGRVVCPGEDTLHRMQK